MAADVLTGVLAFIGAGIGSTLVYLGTRAQTRSEGVARRREEWGRRFTTALDRFTSPDPATRAMGRALLVELMDSDLATEDDRRTAEAVLDADATGGRPNLRLLLSPNTLDEVNIVRDTGDKTEDPDGPKGGQQ